MKIKIRTKVKQPYQKVFKGFTKELFLKLNPPFPPVKLLQFDGCKTNDRVIIKLNFILFSQIWESLITNMEENENEIFFIDKGIKLPFFLKKWSHKHIILETKKGETYIIDDIQFRTPTWLSDIFMYPILFLQFLYRKPIYKKIFK